MLNDPAPEGIIPLDDPVFGNFEGLEIRFQFSNVDSDAKSIFGDFIVGAALIGNKLTEVELTLQEIFGPITFEPDFEFAFNAGIAPVPLPAALPMLLGGFAVFGLLGWRCKAVA